MFTGVRIVSVTFIPLGDEKINSSLEEISRLVIDSQPHPLALPHLNETDIHECLSSGRQKCGSHKGKYLGCTEDTEVFLSLIPEAYPSPDWQYADRHYHAKG